MVTIDGNTAAYIAHALSGGDRHLPDHTSSNMGETADELSAAASGIYGGHPDVVELQSEGGASGAIHGAATAGSLTTTFTAPGAASDDSQHVQDRRRNDLDRISCIARTVATHALSIFGDHSDVMATVPPALGCWPPVLFRKFMDLATVAHISTLLRAYRCFISLMVSELRTRFRKLRKFLMTSCGRWSMNN